MRPLETGEVRRGPDDLAGLAATLAARPYARRGVPMSDGTIRVVIAEDHALMREGLRLLLRAAPDIAVVGETDSTAAFAMAERIRPDVLVLDFDRWAGKRPVGPGDLREVLAAVRALVLTVRAERDLLLALLKAGARGYLTKDAAARDLVDAIRVVAAGDVYVRPADARRLAASAAPAAPAVEADTPRTRYQALSDRERTIVRMVAQGFSGAEVARQLHVSTKTIDAYKRRVGEKLGLTHRTQYVRFALDAGILGE